MSTDEETLRRILLLGRKGSGKTTFCNQLRVYYNKWNILTKETLPTDIRKFVLNQFRNLLTSMVDELGRASNNESLNKLAKQLISKKFDSTRRQRTLSRRGLPFKFQKLVSSVWTADLTQSFWKRHYGKSHNFEASLDYFLVDIERFFSTGLVPILDDFLHFYQPTLQLERHTLTIEGHSLEFIDSGSSEKGQAELYLDVMGADVVFFVSLAEFDQFVDEESTLPAIEESLGLFKDLVTKTFKIVLLFTKRDVLQKKLQYLEETEQSLDYFFPELKLGIHYEGAQQIIENYILDRYTSIAEKAKKKLHILSVDGFDQEDTISCVSEAIQYLDAPPITIEPVIGSNFEDFCNQIPNYFKEVLVNIEESVFHSITADELVSGIIREFSIGDVSDDKYSSFDTVSCQHNLHKTMLLLASILDELLNCGIKSLLLSAALLEGMEKHYGLSLSERCITILFFSLMRISGMVLAEGVIDAIGWSSITSFGADKQTSIDDFIMTELLRGKYMAEEEFDFFARRFLNMPIHRPDYMMI